MKSLINDIFTIFMILGVICFLAICVNRCVRYDPVKSTVADVQRERIESWEYTVEVYLKYKDSDNPSELEFAEQAKEKANDIARVYNQDMLAYGNLFGETLPDGLYAIIEKIE